MDISLPTLAYGMTTISVLGVGSSSLALKRTKRHRSLLIAALVLSIVALALSVGFIALIFSIEC